MSYKNNNYAHGIMFHHFHNSTHYKGQGSITAEEFEKILEYISKKNNILDSDEFTFLAIKNKLKSNDVCITFDDSLKCQIDVALPVLESKKIKAFFFLYSSVLLGQFEMLEVYRYLRNSCFESLDKFYEYFFKKANDVYPDLTNELSRFKINDIYPENKYPFYSTQDKIFRIYRDLVLGKERYQEIMNFLVKLKIKNLDSLTKNLWMSEADVARLDLLGHTIGLHSFSHPTKLNSLSVEEQYNEYFSNQKHLSELLNKKINTVSHPVNSYNLHTLKILQDLGVEIGFCDNMSNFQKVSLLEIPREDHSNILRELK